ncbi:hypothetical protein, partial [Streptomyces sp. NRRL S-495]|uniref:hypothetical protein n=1 Tax=Streptomyces sp. NRRL S-495 TaxID=1609133 RepID=UPI0005F99761
ALASVAEAMARAGQHEQALNLTRTITDADQQDQALARVVTGSDGFGGNRVLVAEAMSLGSWETATLSLGSALPQLFAELDLRTLWS